MKNMMIELDKAMTKDHTGKMAGMWSLSTSCMENPICERRRAQGDAVCAKCYAWRQLERQKTTREKMARNTELLTKNDITPADVPFINSQLFRFESFGELSNTQQAKNYFTIAAGNPHCTFALWTKNAFLVRNAIDEYGISKPDNLIIIASMPKINHGTPAEIEDTYNVLRASGYDFVDKVFTVYTKDYVKKREININCGANNCAQCRRCYTKNGEHIINELLK